MFSSSLLASLIILLTLVVVLCDALSRNDPEVEGIAEENVNNVVDLDTLGLIKYYWKKNKKYAVILAYLCLVHGVCARLVCGMKIV